MDYHNSTESKPIECLVYLSSYLLFLVIWAIASDELIDLVFTDCGHVQLLFVFFFSAWFPNKFNGRKLNSNPWSTHGYGDVMGSK